MLWKTQATKMTESDQTTLESGHAEKEGLWGQHLERPSFPAATEQILFETRPRSFKGKSKCSLQRFPLLCLLDPQSFSLSFQCLHRPWKARPMWQSVNYACFQKHELSSQGWPSYYTLEYLPCQHQKLMMVPLYGITSYSRFASIFPGRSSSSRTTR